MESKLELIADLMRFSGEDYFPEVSAQDDELSLDTLELVSAAGAQGVKAPDYETFRKRLEKK